MLLQIVRMEHILMDQMLIATLAFLTVKFALLIGIALLVTMDTGRMLRL